MTSFAVLRGWVNNAVVRRTFLPITAAAAVAIVGVGTSAEEQAAPAKRLTTARKVVRPADDKIAADNPLLQLFSTLITGTDSPANPTANPAVKPAAAVEPATHTRQSEFLVKGHDDKGWLQSFAVDSQGRLLAAVGSRATYGVASSSAPAATREVQVFSAEGKPLAHWPLDFDPQRIAVGPKDEVFVAGAGKIARLEKSGKVITQVDSPHIGALLGDPDALKESAEQHRKQMINTYQEAQKSMEQQKGLLEKRIAVIDEQAKKAEEEAKKAAEEAKKAEENKNEAADKPAEDETASEKKRIKKLRKAEKASEDSDGADEPRVLNLQRQATRPADRANPQLTALKRQLNQNEAQIKAYQQVVEQQQNRSVDEIIQEIKQRLQKINAIAVSDNEVFLTTGIAKGYGFAVWRTDLDFKEPKEILSNLSGCCGQMDVQAIGGELFIAENSRHRVGHYDRDGKLLGTFGSRERESGGPCFGGCCNPMNVCLGPNGTVLTSESEGFVKSFQTDGTFVGLVGKAQVSGGCKNVSIATSPDGDRIYFYDLEKSRVVVMAREKPTEEPKPEKTALKD